MSDETLKFAAGTVRAADGGHALVQELTERAIAREHLAEGDGVSVAVVPTGHGVALLDTEQIAARPARRRGEATFTELLPFAGYVNAHRGDGTTVWLEHDVDQIGQTSKPIGSIVAVIDDHRPEEAGWGEHTAKYPIRTTPQWQHWLAGHNKWLDQEDFSEHLREGLSEIMTPDAATVLEVAENLTITETSTLSSVVRSGGDLKIEHARESTGRSAAGKTETEIPEVFVLSIAPFAASEPVQLEARLKYRNRGGQLQLGYVLVRPLEAVRDAVDRLEAQLRDAVHGDLTDRVYRGAPINDAQRRRFLVTPEVETV